MSTDDLTKEDREALTITKPYEGGPASYELLCELHHQVCVRLLNYVRDQPDSKLRAQMIACAIVFLKHNGIKADKRSTTESIADSLESLAGADMPFDPDDGSIH